ncbi:expressed unknown protein [Seminavis robusta]|uniref:Uncharacterized protein n=1 Tax=Seminavis robusta TaxID=568900 RepID=A0A9N8HWE9_9STRA|nr:expressed unknown protein [Seminavis robusta]|eukprot:Sro2161_g317100.1 n/a (573) ;mRNA; r:4522-6240
MSVGESIIAVSKALELTRYSHNDETLSRSFSLRFSDFSTEDEMKFVGATLRKNHQIEWLLVDLCGKSVREECLEGLSHFISNAPSLRSLHLDDSEDGSSNVGHLLMQAASKNKHIRKIDVSRSVLKAVVARGDLPLPLFSLQELQLHCVRGLSKAFPESHGIPNIRLKSTSEHHSKSVSNVLQRLAKSKGTQVVECLEMATWSPQMSSFLQSPNCKLQTLHMRGIDFAHSNGWYSSMDGLLWGLAGSQSIKLVLQECTLDELAKKKLFQGLRSNLLGIRDLNFITAEGFAGKDFERLLGCESLESLGFECHINSWDDCYLVDPKKEYVERGIESCSLSSLKLSTDCLAFFGPALMAACTSKSLKCLTLTNCSFRDEDTACLCSILEAEGCKLCELTISAYTCGEDDGDDVLVSSLFEALCRNAKLHTLKIQDDNLGAEIPDTVSTFVGNIGENLVSLEISLLEELLPCEEDAIAEALPDNWYLQNLKIQGTDNALLGVENRNGKPVTTHSLNTKLEMFTRRNQVKKAIFDSPMAFTEAEKKEWLETLASASELPDYLTLAFLLFQMRTGCFF